MHYTNPIIPGFHPDPSICRVGDTYYLVTSSFNYFPGVPLFESHDLLNWTQIGHVLSRPSQLPLQGSGTSGGIFAPTICEHNGRFYMVTTNTSHGGNFFVWTDDIHGSWSEPVFIHRPGIDPSLLFDGDKVYFTNTGKDDNGVAGIVQCEIDPVTGEQLTPASCIWQGTGGRNLEGPHLYHIGTSYYLLASEGGTEYGHMLVLGRGDRPNGPFVLSPHEPLLTNRDLGGSQLQGCGHGDLVKGPDDHWWVVHLGFRQMPDGTQYHTLGREVCLVQATFDEAGWLHLGDHGTASLTMTADGLTTPADQPAPLTFTNSSLGQEWVFLREPISSNYQQRPTGLTLQSGVALEDGQE